MSQQSQLEGSFSATSDSSSRYSNSNYNQQMLQMGSARTSPYSKYYPNLVVSLYFGKGDGEIFLINDATTGKNKMVTCIDISTLY